MGRGHQILSYIRMMWICDLSKSFLGTQVNFQGVSLYVCVRMICFVRLAHSITSKLKERLKEEQPYNYFNVLATNLATLKSWLPRYADTM
jgi:hypothetical protein